MYRDENGIWRWKYKPELSLRTGYEDVLEDYNAIVTDRFSSLSEADKLCVIKRLISEIRKRNVFPIKYYTDRGVECELRSLLMRKPIPARGNKIMAAEKRGAMLLDFLFPNMHRAKAGNVATVSIYDRFYDDYWLYTCLHYHLKRSAIYDMRAAFIASARYLFKTPTSFNISRAKSIYHEMLPNGGVVYDYACGFGARMLGALTQPNFYYVGCEPDSNTYANLCELGTKLQSVTGSQDFEIHNACSEDLILPTNSVDFAFSCPPYFSLERYCDEATQSYNRYPVYSDWLKYYVAGTAQNIHAALKEGGLVGTVIGDAQCGTAYRPLRKDWVDTFIANGFELLCTYDIASASRKKYGPEALYILKRR